MFALFVLHVFSLIIIQLNLFFSIEPDKPIVSEDHICSQSIFLQLKLQQSNEVIERLKKRCSERTKEVARLRASLKRVTMHKMNLKEILDEIKEKKMISEEGHQILQVNVFNF